MTHTQLKTLLLFGLQIYLAKGQTTPKNDASKDSSPKVMNLACLIPYTKTWPLGNVVAAGIIVGIKEVYKRNILPGYDVEFIWADSWCQPARSMKVMSTSLP